MTTEPKPKRKKPVSMTAHARRFCARNGWHYGKVDQFIPGTFIARDLFGLVDAIVLDGAHGILGVQVTSGANHAARRTKIVENPLAIEWLRAGGRLEVWSWSKTKPRGAEKATWTPRIDIILLSDCVAPPTAVSPP